MSHSSQDRTARADHAAEGLWDEQEGGVLSNRDANFVERHAGTLDEHADLGWKGGQHGGAASALRPGQELSGEILELDGSLHTVTLANGEVYAVDADFNMGGFAQGERVRLTAGRDGLILSMTPEPKQ